ncbi:MAG TPA: pseudouridine synthase, partial [Spirochaetales bacterium]|nr:pseudouridine synthase [Spirochaetales bacterium]
MSEGRRRSGSGGPTRAAGGSATRATAPGGRPRVAFLYEDDDLVAVDKPCGLATIAPEGSRSKSLYDVVTAHIRRRNPKGRAAVVHRLDRDTSGVIVFAKNAHAKAALM